VSRIRGVICDFGGVLTSPLQGAFAALQETAGISMQALGSAMARWAETRDEHPLFDLERGRLTEAEFLAGLDDALSEELGRPVRLERFAERYFESLQPNREMIEYMRGLRDRGLQLAILTNNVREWEPLWRRMLPVDEIFDVVVDSGWVGMRKPEREIYELTLERLGLPAPACVFVDDTDVNCEAAGALGMKSVLFSSTEQAVAEIEAALDGGAA
jgi:putative hydrolase of the HAD superfamily